MISTSAVLLRRLTLFDDTLKNLRSGLDKGPIIIDNTTDKCRYGTFRITKEDGNDIDVWKK